MEPRSRHWEGLEMVGGWPERSRRENEEGGAGEWACFWRPPASPIRTCRQSCVVRRPCSTRTWLLFGSGAEAVTGMAELEE